MSATGSLAKVPLYAIVGPKAARRLPVQFQPSTESAPERVSCHAHAGEAGSDRVRAARRRTGPHSIARVL